ncbi:ATP-dependent helicase HrpB [Saccharomonospora marina XMU15]|uniref:ATP-dependent helicase HrpB n=1 Tax=Saccharomonospora marina XMU15 TaxID=882083 RepID=H5WWA6_9PSEU|nr:ATP-dependent helicase HrpB [Saccharomonospora marina]EHR49388.1 ATP-dependent helicase HrpB [Saccharomonospora marina XMU15]
MIPPSELPDLPVRDVLADVRDALDRHGAAVLVAPPGTGKTTLVPLAMANWSPGRIVVAEPRRLAARAAAARMAALLGEPLGRTVGYSVRGDRMVSGSTRIEVVTSGLLVRRLQADPELRGTSAVLLDECHERHLDADLLLTLLLDVRGGLREDLRLLATSATVASQRLADLLGGAPVVTADARTFPVEVVHHPPARAERIENRVARSIGTALARTDGDVLAFLPGAAEIARVADLLDLPGVDVLPLHGRLTAARQDAALREGPRRRVVLATAVAESSLTVPGVRAVVDSGLARVPRIDHRRGLPGLATVRVSAAVARQRAGRAGRQGPGLVYRCWPRQEHASLPAYPEPEIRVADLSRLALELACWSTPDGRGLSWWDPPPEGALAAGRQLLHTLGATRQDGTPTRRGERMAALGLHPRLARALLDGAAEVGPRSAAEVVALLDAGGRSVDIAEELRRLARGDDPAARWWRREAARLARLVEGPAAETPDPATVVALAHPERLARRRGGARGENGVYLLAAGTAVRLPSGSGLADSEWLAVAEATREPGRAHGVVRLAARADAELATRVAASLVTEAQEVHWRGGDIVARAVRRLGAITLTESRLADPDPALLRAAAMDGLRREGLNLLDWPERAVRLRQRLAFLHAHLGRPWPDVGDDALLERAQEWLEPELSAVRRRADLARIDTAAALARLLPWPQAGQLDELAPERLEVPSGSRPRVDYSAAEPVLAVKLQETFGWRATPRIAGGRVPVVLHLLSPAGRPAAVTADLESFWRNGYPGVRAELRGRYPKHPWPQDPLAAEPTRRTTKSR